jgi:hypothetical protein
MTGRDVSLKRFDHNVYGLLSRHLKRDASAPSGDLITISHCVCDCHYVGKASRLLPPSCTHFVNLVAVVEPSRCDRGSLQNAYVSDQQHSKTDRSSKDLGGDAFGLLAIDIGVRQGVRQGKPVSQWRLRLALRIRARRKAGAEPAVSGCTPYPSRRNSSTKRPGCGWPIRQSRLQWWRGCDVRAPRNFAPVAAAVIGPCGALLHCHGFERVPQLRYADWTMTTAQWFTLHEHGGFPIECAALGACDLSVLRKSPALRLRIALRCRINFTEVGIPDGFGPHVEAPLRARPRTVGR